MHIASATYQRKVWKLVGLTLLVKIVLSILLELGNDEVYYYTYALQPDWSHFDHPPMVGWLIRLSTLNLHWVNTVSMRLGAIVFSGMATLVIFETGTLLKNEKAGYIASLLYTFSIYTSIIAGMFIMPDSPQMLFNTLSIYLMVKWIKKPHLIKTIDFILLGLFIGLSVLSKVHGLFLWFGWGMYILLFNRKTLADKRLYFAALITIICLMPILYWNIQNDFITYTYHSKRVTHTGINMDSFLQEIVGEIVYQNPFVYFAAIIPLFRFKRLCLLMGPEAARLLLLLSLPLLLVFWAVSLFNPTLPHWTGPAFIGFILMAGVYWASHSDALVPKIVQIAMGFMAVVIIGFVLLVYVFPKQMGSTKNENLGEYNPINDVTGWETCATTFNTIREKDIQANTMQVSDPLVIQKWFPGGHILFYIARPLAMPVLGFGQLEDIHKFRWLNNAYPALKTGDNAYTIVPSNLPLDAKAAYAGQFQSIDTAGIIPVEKSGLLLRKFYVLRLKAYQGIKK